MKGRALVLGAGHNAAYAGEVSVVAGITEAGLTESAPRIDLKQGRDAVDRAKQDSADREEILRRIGMLALTTASESGTAGRVQGHHLIAECGVFVW